MGGNFLILSGKEIFRRLGEDIIIEPFDSTRLNPNSYNLRLHNELLVYEGDILDMKEKNAFKRIVIPEEGLLLEPTKLYLGRTVEFTETKNLVPMLEGRSSVGRLGLSIHITAGFGDVGFKGFWTLEIHSIHPIKIYPNVEICQIYYHTICGEYENYSSGKYQGNQDIQTSLLYKDFEK
jgi:dCTP deaminase